jgi:hypothetical protein
MVALWRNVGGRFLPPVDRPPVLGIVKGAAAPLHGGPVGPPLTIPARPEELAAVEEPPRSEDGPGVGDLSERAVRGQALSVVVLAE